MLSIHARACGRMRSCAHANAGDPWAISGYLGNADGLGTFQLP
jgi:hypothetical protein